MPRAATITTTDPINTDDLASRLRTIIAELGTVIQERGEVLEALMLCILSRTHGFLQGPPGTAKSLLITLISQHIEGSKPWRVLLDPHMGKEEVFGPIDMPLYDKTGQWERNITDTFADCHFALLDEAGKASPAILNQTLTMLEEGMFKPNGKWIKVPLVSTFAASNEWLALDEGLGALWDRFPVRLSVGYLKDRNSWMAMMRSDTTVKNPTLVTIDEINHAGAELVPAVKVPQAILDRMWDLRSTLGGLGIECSDRRMRKALRLVQASAFLAGRTSADEDDLQVLRWVLWDLEEQRNKVVREVMKVTSPLTRAVLEFDTLLDDLNSAMDSRAGKSNNDAAQIGADVQKKTSELKTKLDRLRESTLREGRDPAKLDAVGAKLHTMRKRLLVDLMGVPEERAAAMAL